MASEGAGVTDGKTQYETAKSLLTQALAKKRAIDKTIASLEVQIYHFEGSYLTDTAASGGNIIQGFDGYLKNHAGSRRRQDVSDNDRLFSNSSATYLKSLELQGDGTESVDDGAMSMSAHTPRMQDRIQETPSAASAALLKRERDRMYQRRKRASFKAASTTGSGDEYEQAPSKPNKRRRMADDD